MSLTMSSPSQPLFQISDEEVFRRKLLMDGEGLRHDRKINSLLRSFFNWNDAKDVSEEEMVFGYNKLLRDLANCEFLMRKSQQAQIVNEAEITLYGELYTHIEAKIAVAQQTILEKKAELQQSETVSKKKQQYDALAKRIAEQPDCKETHSKLQFLGEEITNLQKTKQELQMKLDECEKQIKILLSATYKLEQIIKS